MIMNLLNSYYLYYMDLFTIKFLKSRYSLALFTKILNFFIKN